MEIQTTLVSQATDIEKGEFYKKTYLHVAFALLAFALVEYILLFNIPEEYIIAMVSQKFAWLLILGLFWLGSTLANKWTLSQSKNVQYLGLAFYVLLEAIIFLPMIYLAVVYTESLEVLKQAALLTLALFGGLTAVAFLSNKDFSFLKNVIVIGGFASAITGFVTCLIDSNKLFVILVIFDSFKMNSIYYLLVKPNGFTCVLLLI